MREIQCSTFLEREGRRLALWALLFLILGCGALGIFFGRLPLTLAKEAPWLWGLTLALGLGALAAGQDLFSEALGWWQGALGERAIARRLGAILDDQFYLLRNVTLPKQRGDIDAILIGPPGILALEIKDKTGVYRVDGRDWLYLSHGRWRSSQSNPMRQAQANARRTEEFLAKAGLAFSTRPVVVLANSLARVTIDNPAVYIVLQGRLERFIQEWCAHSQTRLNAIQAAQAAAILKG